MNTVVPELLRLAPAPRLRLNIHSLPQVPIRYPPISPTRKILCATALALSALCGAPAGATAGAPAGAPAGELHQLDHPADSQVDAVRMREGGPGLQHAGLAQKGRELIFTLRTSEPVALAGLEKRPNVQAASGRYLCLAMSKGSGERLVCLGGGKAHSRVGLVTVDANGKPLRKGSVAATVKRPQPDKLVVALDPAAAGLPPRRYRWRVIASAGCEVRARCAETLPATGASAFRLRPVRAVGCTGGSAGLVTNGPRDRRVVALTFDDGPSEYTDDFLAILREKSVPGTFFEVGQEMPGREDVMRQILAEGNELGDHTMNHVEYPGYDQIAGAGARIRAYTHFTPCLFRPPGGGVNASVVATAGSLGMRTINWDVDPRDWSLPGTGAIYSNIVSHARNGSIILMHDGGGPRSETLAALPHVIDTLRARGFGFATVSELLGYRILYRPYG
jgi:peptidoglycan/xylan/chitin deacetylase (PgdA/CDA1 family)